MAKQEKVEGKAVVAQPSAGLPVLASFMEEDAGAGFEGADRASYAIPFLSVLQSGSPQCKKSDGAYIKGAEEGMLYNSVTQEIINGEEGVEVIPCYFTRRFTHWGPRSKGGGLKGEYAPDDPILLRTKGEGGVEAGTGAGRYLPDDRGEYNKDTSDIINDTRTHYVLVLREDGSYTPAVVSMGSTQIRKSRLWMSKMEGLKAKRADGTLYTPPMFSHVYRLTTVPESNDQGSWYGWKVELVRPLAQPDLYQAAKMFRDAIKAGEVKTQPHEPEQPTRRNRDPGDDDDVAF